MHVFSIAFRFFLSKKNNNRKTVLCIIFGIALSIAALLVVVSAIDNLQNSQLEVIRDLESFDLVIENPSFNPDEYKQIPGIGNAFIFNEQDILISNTENSESQTCLIRFIDKDIYSDSENISFSSSSDGLYLSYQMLHSLKLSVGDSVQLTVLKKGKTKILTPINRNFRIAGTYNSFFPSFNNNRIIFSGSDADFSGNQKPEKIGIYSKSNVETVKDLILQMDKNCTVKTWKEENFSLYSALTFEKTAVSCFLMLICILVCVNLRTAMLRITHTKSFDAGILRVLGYTRRKTSAVFYIYGFLITFIGELFGIILSVVLTENINFLFSFFDSVFGFFGAGLYLSYFYFNLCITPVRFSVVCITVSVFAFFFIHLGARKILRNDVMEVITNASN